MKRFFPSWEWIVQHPHLLLAITLCGGLLLRLYGIGFGLPHVYDPDEPVSVDTAVSMLVTHDLNPHWFGWPGTTLVYMLSVLFAGIFLVGRWLGVFESTVHLRELYFQDPTMLYLSGRVLLAVVGVASICVAYVIARRLFNRPTALIGAMLLALSPLHVFHSKLNRPDILLTFLILATFWSCLEILERQAWSGYVLAGLFAGLGIATKYPAASVALVIVMAHLLSGPWRWTGLLKLLVCGVVSVLGAFVGSPFLFLDFRTALLDAVYENYPRHLSGTGEGLIQNLMWYVQGPLVEAVSIGGLVLAGIGIVLAMASRQKDRWLLLVFSGVFLVFMASLNLRWERWMIPIVPFLCMLAAHACHWTAVKIGERWDDRIGRVAGCILVLVIAVPLLGADILQGREMSGSDTRTLAKEWMMRHVPAGSRVLLERYTPQFPRDLYTFLQVRHGQVVEVDVRDIPTALFRPPEVIGRLKDTDALVTGLVTGKIEYMALSDWYDRYSAEREKYADYAQIVATYDALMSMGTKVYEVKRVRGESRGPTIRVYRFEKKD